MSLLLPSPTGKKKAPVAEPGNGGSKKTLSLLSLEGHSHCIKFGTKGRDAFFLIKVSLLVQIVLHT